MTNKLKILISPLDWGLGHATRCISIIRALLELNHEVVIASDKAPLRLLKLEFPELKFVVLPGYDISYSEHNMELKMLLSVPKILSGIRKEHQALKRIIDDLNIDLVISDNRYGLWSDKIPSIFITHQIQIKAPAFANWLNSWNRKLINRFSECWIPDVEGDASLSGTLSDSAGLKVKTRHLGVLSRFSKSEHEVVKQYGLKGKTQYSTPY